MRFFFLSLDFGLLLLVLVTLLQGASAQCREECHPANCVTPDKCEDLNKGRLPCKTPGTVCCSVVKLEHRNLCHHHGGECMNRCSPIITRQSTDCKAPQRCCVLV